MGMFDNWMGMTDNKQQPIKTNVNGSAAGNQGNAPEDETNLDPNSENNTGSNQELITQLWNEKKDETAGGEKKPGEQPTITQPAQKTDEQLRAEISTHLGSVGLGDIALSAQDVEKLSGENSHQEFANLINTRIQQAYLQSMQSAQKLMRATLDAELPKMVEQAVSQSKSFFSGENLRSVLRTDEFLKPLMDDPATSPVVETVIRQFIVKGANREQAIQHTRDYFQRVRKAMDPNYVPPNPNTRTTFRGNPRTAMSFLDVLKGK